MENRVYKVFEVRLVRSQLISKQLFYNTSNCGIRIFNQISVDWYFGTSTFFTPLKR